MIFSLNNYREVMLQSRGIDDGIHELIKKAFTLSHA
jgi:hypothetical protein